ncbi:H-NS histone family protein [Variovorax sp. J31P207]|nr:H-NS histone family protein [Variovorax sp. J31P207]MDM0067027.1 H-NS histone family protein [Variovorax sp. J31P207]
MAKLEREADALREAEMTKVVAQIKESIATFGLTAEHLFGRGAKALKAATGKALGGGKAERKGAGILKYRHPKTGKTWTGFGKAPGWIASVRNCDKFLIDQSGVVAAPSVEKAVAPVAAVAKKATRKARAVAAPAKKSIRAPKVTAAPVAALEAKAENRAQRKLHQRRACLRRRPLRRRRRLPHQGSQGCSKGSQEGGQGPQPARVHERHGAVDLRGAGAICIRKLSKQLAGYGRSGQKRTAALGVPILARDPQTSADRSKRHG